MPFKPDGSWVSKSGVDYGFGAPKAGTSDGDEFTADRDEYVARTGRKPSAGTDVGHEFDKIGKGLGFTPQVVDETAPGATLQTGAADAQRDRTQGFIAALQQQAATGDGAWQQKFAEAVKQTQNAAQALGQSDPSSDYGAAQTNISNAQSAAGQRAVGDEALLREQAKLDARGQLADVLGSTAQMDLAQSAEVARVNRERRAASQAAIDQTQENRKGTEKSITGAFSMGMGGGMSEGGEVPGRAEAFGNDERNDTVPAWLSPKEIVIPRDIAMAPDAPEQAARFVAAVKAGHDPQANGGDPRKLAEGGSPPPSTRRVTNQEVGGEGMVAAQFLGGPFARDAMYNKLRTSVGSGDGGQLDMTQYDQTATQQNQLASLFAGSAVGSGPSIVPMVTQRRTDDTIGAAQAAQGRAPAADVVKGAAIEGAETAAGAGREAAREVSQGQAGYAGMVKQGRGQELQRASAEQQAGFGKILADMGLSLKSQAELRGSLQGAGQGAAAFSAQGRGKGPEHSTTNDLQGSGGRDHAGFDDPTHEAESKAYGGMVGNYADGGKITARGPNGERLDTETDAATRAGDARRKSIYDRIEYEEETGDSAAPGKKRKPDEKETAFAKAVRAARDFAGKAGGYVAGFAEGGGVADGGGYTPYDPYAAPPQPASPQVVYVSPTPVPGTQPVNVGGAGGGGGSDMGMGGAGGAGGASGAVPGDRGSGGATGGPSGSQIPQHEAIQPRAQRPPQAPALPTGVVPKGGAPAPTPAPKAEGAHAPKGGGVPRPGGAGADELARKAALTQYEADNQAAVASSEAAAAETSAVETQINERKAVVARSQAKVAQAQTRYQQAVDEMSRIDTSVDPGRFWASRTTGDKVVGILGLVLGALGVGPDGINRAAVMLNDAVNRDLEAQKSEHEFRLKKGSAKVGAAQNFYAMAREMAGDEVAATDLAHAAALQSVVAKGKALMASTQDAQAKARLAGVIASIEQGAAQRAAGAWEKSADRALEREKIHAAAGKDATAAKDLRNSLTQNAAVEQMVGDLKGLIGDTNIVTEKVGTKAGRMKTIAGQLITKLKEQEKLGAYDKGTADLAEQIIGDPTATFTMDSTKMAKLDEVLKSSRRDVQNLAGAMR